MSFVKISELPLLVDVLLPLTAGDVMPIVHGPTTYKVELSTLAEYFQPSMSARGGEGDIQFNANGQLSGVDMFTYLYDLSSLKFGSENVVTSENAVVLGGRGNAVGADNTVIVGGQYNKITNVNSFTIGSYLSTNADNTTFVNNLSVQSDLSVGDDIIIDGDINVENVYADGNISAGGNVTYQRARPNLIYVATDGNDSNVGTNPSQPFRTIKRACQYVSQNQQLVFPVTSTIGFSTKQYTIFVMTGDYTEENPIYVPQQTSIIGDNLRRVTIRPRNRYYDILWLNAACYVWGFTFRDHLEPSAATAFPNLNQARPEFAIAFNYPGYEISSAYSNYYRLQRPYINTSPYTQGNSSITSSIVAPWQTAVTQTISAATYMGPNTTILNTASSRVQQEFETFVDIILRGPSASPKAGPVVPGNIPADSQTVVSLLTANRSTIQDAATAYIDTNYPSLFTTNVLYKQQACYRDAGYIIDCVVADILAGNNSRIVEAGNVYYVGTLNSSATPPSVPLAQQLTYPQVWNYVKQFVITSYTESYVPASDYIATEFDTLTAILANGYRYVPLNSLSAASADDQRAALLLSANRFFFQNELTAYVDNVYLGFAYGQSTEADALTAKAKCYRDMGWIIDAITYDLSAGTNARAITYANSYYLGARSRIANQEVTTAATVNYGKYLASFVVGNSAVRTTAAGCGIRVDGSLARGFLRSFVTDSYTQINEGGLGIHITNNGYAQLVSTFTICCSEGIRADNGGNCSINTSNCSFGLSGLTAVGKSLTPVLTGTLLQDVQFNTAKMVISGIFPRYDAPDFNTYPVPITTPYVGLVFTVEDDPTNTLYVLASAYLSNENTYTYDIFTNQAIKTDIIGAKTVNFYIRSQLATGSHTFEYIGSGNVLSQAVPALGGVANTFNEARASDGGAVYFTSTNHLGDFKVGNDFVILQETGTIEGRTFKRAILALVTPLTLALE